MLDKIKSCRTKFSSLASRAHFVPEILTRITLGILFAQAGWGKFGRMEGVISYFDSLGIPAAHIQAPFVAGVELVAGILILIGLGTRYAALPLIGVMAVAIRTALWENVEGISSLFEMSEFLYIVLLVWLVSTGSKTLSLDAWLRKKCGCSTN